MKTKTPTIETATCRHGDDCAVSKFASSDSRSSHAKTCDERSRTSGTNESHVREILQAVDKPLTAYDIIPLLSKKLDHAVAPTTVYRALNHLTAHGVVTRIESRNAYVLCQHPHENHDCLFFICRECGAATEAPDNKISRLLHKEAETLGFDVSRQILEIVGLCKSCAQRPQG